MNTKIEISGPWWLPFVVGGALVVQFIGLAVWQVDRGLQKRENQELFATQSGFTNFSGGSDVRPYQRLSASGTLDSERQFLLDNIIIESRIGYYVMTPLELAEDEPLLMINRGWIERSAVGVTPDIGIPASGRTTVRGRAGSLPKAGYRMGEAIEGSSGWPQTAVYPSAEDLEQALGRDIQHFVLLMEPDDKYGYLRHWVPAEMGPGRHFAYAFQWFAMALVLAGLLVWNFRRKRFSE